MCSAALPCESCSHDTACVLELSRHCTEVVNVLDGAKRVSNKYMWYVCRRVERGRGNKGEGLVMNRSKLSAIDLDSK